MPSRAGCLSKEGSMISRARASFAMETAQGRTMGPRERVPSAVVGLTVSSVPQVDLVHQSAPFVSSPTRACPLLCFVSVWPAPDSSQTLHSFSIRISKPCRSLGFAASCSRRVVWCVGRGENGRLSSLPFPQIFNVLFYGSHLFFFAYGWYSQVGITLSIKRPPRLRSADERNRDKVALCQKTLTVAPTGY